LYELLTGKLPFDAKAPIEYIQLHANATPIPLSQRRPEASFPPGLEEVVMRALAKEPAERYASAAEFAIALEAVLQPRESAEGLVPISLPIPAPTASMGSPFQPAAPLRSVSARRRSKASWIVFGVGIVLAVAGAIALWASFGSGS